MNQKQVWENIADEWHEFKKLPALHTTEFLKKQTGKILDLGSGSGRHLMKIKKGKMYLLDFSEKMIKLAEQKAKKEKIKAKFSVSEMTKIPYENNFFDAAICISSLHCLKKPKQKKAVEELYRVLKPKAQAFIGVWNRESKRFKKSQKEKLIGWRDKGARYYYLYTEKEIHNQFKKAGFKIIETANSEMMIRFIVEK
ncbi:MAG: class I SAM-dependent methyltransferase [Nanoarchaeota archaeon]